MRSCPAIPALAAMFAAAAVGASPPASQPATSADLPGKALRIQPSAPADLPAATFKVKRLADIVYVSQPADPKKQILDVYQPIGANDAPVLVFVHGGGWRHGREDSLVYQRLCRVFAGRGIVTVSVGYRLSPKVAHPAHVEDVAAAVAWTHRHVGQYGGRADRMFLSGHSAGGHLVALLATNERYLKAHGLGAGDLAGVLPLSGVYELLHGDETVPELKMITDAFGDQPETLKDASPQRHVRAGLPPFRIVVGADEPRIMVFQAGRLCKALADAGNDTRWMIAPDRGHVELILRVGGNNDPTTAMMLAFIRQRTADLDAAGAVPSSAGSQPDRRRSTDD